MVLLIRYCMMMMMQLRPITLPETVVFVWCSQRQLLLLWCSQRQLLLLWCSHRQLLLLWCSQRQLVSYRTSMEAHWSVTTMQRLVLSEINWSSTHMRYELMSYSMPPIMTTYWHWYPYRIMVSIPHHGIHTASWYPYVVGQLCSWSARHESATQSKVITVAVLPWRCKDDINSLYIPYDLFVTHNQACRYQLLSIRAFVEFESEARALLDRHQ